VATIEVMRQHDMGLQGARQAVQAVALRLQDDLSAHHAWSGDTLKFQCPGAEGRIDVTGSSIRVTVDLSWLLKPVRGRIERSINDTLDEYLA
jgi:putative polyhydroxyalkanoate system protein